MKLATVIREGFYTHVFSVYRFLADWAVYGIATVAIILSPIRCGPRYTEKLLLKGFKRTVRTLGTITGLGIPDEKNHEKINSKRLESAAKILLLIGDSYMLDGRYSKAAKYLSNYKLLAEELSVRKSSERIGLSLLARYYYLIDAKEECIAILRRLIVPDDSDPETFALLVRLTAEVGNQKEAEKLYRRLVSSCGARVPPIIHYVLIPAGDMRPVWASYSVYKTLHPASSVEWRGEDISNKTLMVVAVSGVGDEIRSASTYGELASKTKKMTIVCDHRLYSLFRRSFPAVRVLPMARSHVYGLGRGVLPGAGGITGWKKNSVDFYINNLASLQFTRPFLHSFGGRGSRLSANPELTKKWKARMEELREGRLIVGICWRSGIISYTRKKEYFDLSDWEPILDVAGVLFVNLQYYGDAEIERLYKKKQAYQKSILRIRDADLQNDFEALAALIQACDLVVSSPTNILEFAGILGKDAWMITASSSLSANWRIISDEGKDAWFENVRHYSIARANGKDELFQKVKKDLNSMVVKHRYHA